MFKNFLIEQKNFKRSRKNYIAVNYLFTNYYENNIILIFELWEFFKNKYKNLKFAININIYLGNEYNNFYYKLILNFLNL